MFSRSGAETIAKNRIFKSRFNDIDELIEDERNKKFHIKQNLAELDDLGNEVTNKLPVITPNEDNLPVMEVPGLSAQIHKLERYYMQQKMEQEARANRMQ